MVVLFVIATVLTFIIIDYFIQHREAQLAPAGLQTRLSQQQHFFSRTDDLFLPEGIFSAKGHVWGELSHHGSLNIGVDPFLIHALGQIDRVHVPHLGEKINTGDELLLLQVGDRKIRIRSPFSGIVEKTNTSIETDLSNDIRKLWSVRIKPDNLSETISSCRIGHAAKQWMKEEIARFRDFLSSFSNDPQLALTMQDGGVPVNGSLTYLDDTAWQKFESEFLSVEK